MPINADQAAGMIEKWGPIILKAARFGDDERATLLENAVWAVEQIAEISARAEASEKTVTRLETQLNQVQDKLDTAIETLAALRHTQTTHQQPQNATRKPTRGKGA